MKKKTLFLIAIAVVLVGVAVAFPATRPVAGLVGLLGLGVALGKDLYSQTDSKVALKLQAVASNTTTVGEIIDRQGYEGVNFECMTGAVTDGDYAFHLYAGDVSNMSDEAEIDPDDGEILGDIPDWTDNSDDYKIQGFGYIGDKRYVLLKVVSTNVSSGAFLGAVAILHNPTHGPART